MGNNMDKHNRLEEDIFSYRSTSILWPKKPVISNEEMKRIRNGAEHWLLHSTISSLLRSSGGG